ncbi:transcriptional regulator [Nonomuraea sp. NPDC050556]|uniref:transcriptional regulator n=1 Tax=Nonomuraea sp. NPDC050556 TaxID=3364369 RepID=UPI0037AAFB89
MGWWEVDSDTLASGRFIVSPLAETFAAMQAFYYDVPGHPAQRAWLDEHRARWRAMIAGDPLTAPLIEAAMGARTHWIADLLTPVLNGEFTTFDDELGLVRGTPPEKAWADLVVSSGGPLPERLRRTDVADHLADVLTWVWTEAVLPTWARRRRIIEADILSRTAQLSRDGWAAVLDGMRPGMRWLRDGRLQINVHDFPSLQTRGAPLYFVPVTPARGWVAYDDTLQYTIIYPCSGALADVDATTAPEPLARLLGQNRAQVLVLLDTPKSTTHLVALANQGLGSVGRHLKILLDSGLIGRRRSGKSVLYYRTASGDVLVNSAAAQVSSVHSPTGRTRP